MARFSVAFGSVAVLFLGHATGAVAQTRTPLVANQFANVFSMELPAGCGIVANSTDEHGLVWVAVTRGVVEIAGVQRQVGEGATGRVEGKASVHLLAPKSERARFVVVDVLRADQLLTIESWASPRTTTRPGPHGDESLAPGQALVDHSDANDTLIMAIGPLTLRDVLNTAQEGEDWKPTKPVTIRLKPGEAYWLAAGMHELTNVGGAPARFVGIEW